METESIYFPDPMDSICIDNWRACILYFYLIDPDDSDFV